MKLIASAAAVAFACLTAAPALADPITYTSTGTAADTIHGVTVSYTITTDGNLGALSLDDIVGSTFTFMGASSGEFSFPTFTAQNSLYLYPDTRLFATADGNLQFDFAGGGGVNAGTQNCVAINVCGDNPPSAGTTSVAQGLVYALAGAQSTDDDSVVFHGDNLPVRELDSFADSGYDPGNYYLRDGFFNLVAPTLTTIATATPAATAVPEIGTWAMMIAGIGMAGYAMRRRQSSLRLA